MLFAIHWIHLQSLPKLIFTSLDLTQLEISQADQEKETIELLIV